MLNETVAITKNDCTACSACVYSCPKGAISLQRNELGTKIAVVNEDACINCGKCVKVCHRLSPIEKATPKKVYAAWTNDREKYKNTSSSGGIAALLYDVFLQKGGIAFGAEWRGLEVIIGKAENAVEAQRFAGSKYVESDFFSAIQQILDLLNDGKEVLFIGLPCQIAALKKIFSSDKLFTVDLICHGAPSAEYLVEYVNSLNVYSTYDIRFRGKKDVVFCIYDEQGETVYQKGQNFDPYFRNFLDGITCKGCCYSCPYACSPRVGDVSLGDFWGINRETMQNKTDGKISLVLVNTEKGAALIDQISKDAVMEERTLDEAVRQNRQLISPCTRDKERIRFEKNLKKGGFVYALNKTASSREIKNRYKFFSKLKRKIKIILGR